MSRVELVMRKEGGGWVFDHQWVWSLIFHWLPLDCNGTAKAAKNSFFVFLPTFRVISIKPLHYRTSLIFFSYIYKRLIRKRSFFYSKLTLLQLRVTCENLFICLKTTTINSNCNISVGKVWGNRYSTSWVIVIHDSNN